MIRHCSVLLFASVLAGCVTDDRAGRAGRTLDPAAMVGTCCDDSYDEPPRMLSGKAPIYPIGKMLSGQGGSAVIAYTVGVDGKPRDVAVISTDNKSYSNHAVIALREWTFAPAKKDGVPVDARVEQTFTFARK